MLPTVFITTLWIGGTYESMALMGLTWMYNDLGGGEEHFLVRNLNNALGYVFFALGSLRIATGWPEFDLVPTAYVWTAMMGTVVTSTIQIQDLQDQEGDKARERRTLPLMIGDVPTRWLTAVVVMMWSLVCPAYWRLSLDGIMVPFGFGCIVAGRVLCFRSVKADEGTFGAWCAWLASLYVLPLLKKQSGFALLP